MREEIRVANGHGVVFRLLVVAESVPQRRSFFFGAVSRSLIFQQSIAQNANPKSHKSWNQSFKNACKWKCITQRWLTNVVPDMLQEAEGLHTKCPTMFSNFVFFAGGVRCEGDGA